MISAIESINSGVNYSTLSGTGRAEAKTERLQREDRWIPGGDREEGAYSDRIGMSPGLTDAEQEQVEELKRRDGEVKQHEQTHSLMLGSYAVGSPIYYYQVGPDGKPYAVGGSVTVDMSSTGSSAGDFAKGLKIRAAAGSVSDMSGADMDVAMRAGKGLMFSQQA
jgi:hypothetical protein